MKLEELRNWFKRVRRVKDDLHNYSVDEIKGVAKNILLAAENIYISYKKELIPNSYKRLYKRINDGFDKDKILIQTRDLIDIFLELEKYILRRRY